MNWWEWALLLAWGPSTLAATVLLVWLLPVSVAGRVADHRRSAARTSAVTVIDLSDATAPPELSQQQQ